MIENEFDQARIASVNFAVGLRSSGKRYFVPTDGAVKDALKQVLGSTIGAFGAVDGPWELHDISEDYGDTRRTFAPRTTDYLSVLSEIYDEGNLSDLANAHEHVKDIDYYFGEFRDAQGRRVIGIKKATQLKGTLGARNKLVRLVDDSLQMINDDVLKLDTEFDAVITNTHVFMLKVRSVEYLADIVARVAGTAANKVQLIHDQIPFLDLSRIGESIGGHPRLARLAASIAAREDLHLIRQDRVEEIAKQHGLVLRTVNGRLRCRRVDEAKLLEILDARRYHVDLTATGPVPYRATARQRV